MSLHCVKYYFIFFCFSISVHTSYKVNNDTSRPYSIMFDIICLIKLYLAPRIYVSKDIGSGNIEHRFISIQLAGRIYIHTKLTIYYFNNLFYSELKFRIQNLFNKTCLFKCCTQVWNGSFR